MWLKELIPIPHVVSRAPPGMIPQYKTKVEEPWVLPRVAQKQTKNILKIKVVQLIELHYTCNAVYIAYCNREEHDSE